MSNQNKPQGNVPKVEKSAEAQAEELFDKYGYYVDDSHSSVDFVVGRSVVMQNDFKSACLEIATSLQSRIAELEKQNELYKEALEEIVVSQHSAEVQAEGAHINWEEVSDCLFRLANQAIKDNG